MNKKMIFSFVVIGLLLTGCAKEEKYVSLEERGMKTTAKEANSKAENTSKTKDKNTSIKEGKEEKKAVISVETANFRKEASKEGELIATLEKDQKITLISTETVDGTEWAKISVDGQEGYVLSSFVKTGE